MRFTLNKAKKYIYLDNASATPVDATVFDAMKPFFVEIAANPSGLHKEAVLARHAVEKARSTIEAVLQGEHGSIHFTSGATEANNLAIFGVARKYYEKGKHIISVKTEHSSILEPLKQLEQSGFDVTYLDVNSEGSIDLEALKAALRPDTILVSIMFANNEIGTIAPIADIGRIILKHRKEHNSMFPMFHSDAAQAPNYLTLDVKKLHLDFMTLSSGKIYGPKGVGALYMRKNINIEPLTYGGGQENSLRPGTEYVAGIVGFSHALMFAQMDATQEADRLRKLQSHFMEQSKKMFPQIILNGAQIGDSRLPNNLNITFPGVEAEKLVLYLDAAGVACSTGSACSEQSQEPSHVLLACGLESAVVEGSIRLSMGRGTTKKDIDKVIMQLKSTVSKASV